MLIVMDQGAPPEQVGRVVAAIEARGFTARPIAGHRVAIGVLNNRGAVEPGPFLELPGVKEVIRVTKPYKQVSREFHPEDSVVRVGGVPVGNGHFTLIGGPCAIESEEQARIIARHVRASGAQIFRGGAYKPRTSPYAFQGLGEEGLRILARIRKETGLPVVTEALDHELFNVVEEYADLIQIGARNMQNFSLLRRAGQSRKPVLLKRGMAATVEEWLMAAEYILEGGNDRVILCERGVRTFADHSRNTLDLSVVPAIRQETHLPVIVDPSHATGIASLVKPMSMAAVAAGADGLMIEVHNDPVHALCDGAQSLTPAAFGELMDIVRQLLPLAYKGENK